MAKEHTSISKYKSESESCANDEFCLFYDTAGAVEQKESSHDKRKHKDRQLMAIDNDKYASALRYAFRIMPEVKDYISFCKSLIDFAGRDILPCCDFIYEEVISAIPARIARKLVDARYDEGNGYSDEDVADALDSSSADTMAKNVSHDLDELPYLNIGYGNIDELRSLLRFVGSHNYLSPYNALILYLQKPESTYVFNASVWKDGYDRRPKRDARPVLLQNETGQLQCMFDYGDTETMPKEINSLFDFDYELEDRWSKILEDNRKLTVDKEMRCLQANLPIYGIFLDWTLKANDSFVGYTDLYSDKELTIRCAGGVFKSQSYYRISVNYRYPEEDAFYFICHELARIFCKGYFCHNECSEREMTVKEREFETETVVWIVFRRLGLYNPLDNYLDVFCPDGTVPSYSIEHVMKASAELEQLLAGEVSPKQSPMYKYDTLFRTAADKICK